jgi:hypothetical protein
LILPADGSQLPTSPACQRYDRVVSVLHDAWGERLVYQRVTGAGHLRELWASFGGTWTALEITPSGWACIVGIGSDDHRLTPMIRLGA